MLQLSLNIAYSATVVACIAVSFYLYYRPNKVFHLTHASTMLISSYVFIGLLSVSALPTLIVAGVSFVVATIAGMALTGVLSRVGGGEDRNVFVLVLSIGIALVVENLCTMIFGAGVRRAELGAYWDQRLFVVADDAVVSGPQLLGGVSGLLALTAAVWIWYGTSLGRSARAIAENPELAEIIGMPVARLRRQMLALSSAGAALAGLIICINVGVSPSSGINYLMPGVIGAVIGGSQGLRGVLVASFLIVAIGSLSTFFIGSKWADMATYLLFALVLVLRPSGIEKAGLRSEER